MNVTCFAITLLRILIAALLLMVFGCSGQVATTTSPNPAQPVTNIADLEIVTGQLVFVPAYSGVTFPINNSFRELAVTLAIHNTDLDHSIIIRSVRYYDTEGVLVREFVETPVSLNPLATTGFVVGRDEGEIGWGANFLVEWSADEAVYEPVIEALIYPDGGGEGISFISPGRIISEQKPYATADAVNADTVTTNPPATPTAQP
jgi:hypothetical protein